MFKKSFVLLLTLSLAVAIFAVGPEPKLLEKAKRGEVTLPDFEALHARGIDAPLTLPNGMPAGYHPRDEATSPFNLLVLFASFTDHPNTIAVSAWDAIVYGSTNSVKDFYLDCSYGTFTIQTSNMPSSSSWYTLPQTYSYYVNSNYGFGSYPMNAQRLVEDLVNGLNSVINFSIYDNDGDGYVDSLVVVHTGPGAEFTGSPNDIWSHSWVTNNPPLLDGVYIYGYTIEPEYWQTPGDMTIGVYCHELGHGIFNLPDLYDTDYSSEGLGRWSLMSGGSWNGSLGNSPSHPDAWSRIGMGFLTSTNVTTNIYGASLPNTETTGTIYRLRDSAMGASEYFLVENRQMIGYDTGLPSSGLMIWHVDDNKSTNTSECRNVQDCNCPSAHYWVSLIQADGLKGLEYNTSSGDAGDPYPGSTSNRNFNSASTPKATAYNTCTISAAVETISNSASTMTADLIIGGGSDAPPVVTITNPTSGATVSGTVNFTATATDDVGVSKVEFYVDNVLKSTDTSSPYSWSWNTTTYSDGSHTIKAMAYDTINQTDTDQFNVTVNNGGTDNPPTVTITNPLNGSIVSGTVNVTATSSDDNGVTKIEFYLDSILRSTDTSSPYSWSWDTTGNSGAHTIMAKAYDTINQTGTDSVSVTVGVDNPPSVLISSPADGATVHGDATIQVTATDDVGITNVKLYVDGVLYNNDTTSPYQFIWDTHIYTNSSHTIMAEAYDTAGQSNSTSISLNVLNPFISGVLKKGNPFRLKVSGGEFHTDITVFIGSDTTPWGNIKYKTTSLIVIKGGSSLKARFPLGTPVDIKVKNGDGGYDIYSYTR